MKAVEITKIYFKNYSVCVADFRCVDDLKIFIKQKSIDGSLMFPKPLSIKLKDVLSCPMMSFRGITCYEIPIEFLQECDKNFKKSDGV